MEEELTLHCDLVVGGGSGKGERRIRDLEDCDCAGVNSAEESKGLSFVCAAHRTAT